MIKNMEENAFVRLKKLELSDPKSYGLLASS